MNDPEYARILFRRNTTLVIGPLGVFEKGQDVVLEGTAYVVVAIDHDGAGIAMPSVMIDDPERHAHLRTSYPPSAATPEAQEGMKAQQERNRREYLGGAA